MVAPAVPPVVAEEAAQVVQTPAAAGVGPVAPAVTGEVEAAQGLATGMTT